MGEQFEVYSKIDSLGGIYESDEGALVARIDSEKRAFRIMIMRPARYIRRMSDGATMCQGSPWINEYGEVVG